MTAPLREPPALHDRAIQDLSFIRRTMEGASSFTDVPGVGLVVIGVTGLGAAAVAARQPTAGRWLAAWLAAAVVGATIGGVATFLKMRRRGRPADGALLSTPARKFLYGLVPALVAGALLTFALLDTGTAWSAAAPPRALPGLWLVLYGVGVTTAGAHSVRAVPTMGVGFMMLGAVALFVPAVPGDLLLAAGFGVWQVVIGAWIARRHGG